MRHTWVRSVEITVGVTATPTDSVLKGIASSSAGNFYLRPIENRLNDFNSLKFYGDLHLLQKSS